jgi:hypothetical protein
LESSFFRCVPEPELLPAVAWFDQFETDGSLTGVTPDRFDDSGGVNPGYGDVENASGVEFSRGVKPEPGWAYLFDGHLIGEGIHVSGVTLDFCFKRNFDPCFSPSVFLAIFRLAGFGEQVVVTFGADGSVAQMRDCGEFWKLRDVYEMAGTFTASVASARHWKRLLKVGETALRPERLFVDCV